MAAFIIAATMFNGCGSRSDPASAATAALPPAIPASEPVLLFNGTGTSADVSAVQAVLSTQGVGYTTADSDQLNAMTKAELGGFKLIVVPGGNSIEIGQSLDASTVANVRGAVQQYGVHYLGLCAGAFFGAHSIYNGVNLTGGVSFDFYADEFKGIHQEVIEISFPDQCPPQHLLGRWTAAIGLGRGGGEISRWHSRNRPRAVGQGFCDLHRRASRGTRELVRADDAAGFRECRPGVCGNVD